MVVIVAGALYSGKMMLARRLAKELALPLIAKDAIKKSLFDSPGWSDRQWSKKLGRASYGLLNCFCETQCSAFVGSDQNTFGVN